MGQPSWGKDLAGRSVSKVDALVRAWQGRMAVLQNGFYNPLLNARFRLVNRDGSGEPFGAEVPVVAGRVAVKLPPLRLSRLDPAPVDGGLGPCWSAAREGVRHRGDR